MDVLTKLLESHLNNVRRLVNGIIITVFALIVLAVFSQVVWRFVFNSPFSWSEELARYLQVWLILLASVGCLRKSRHLAIDFLPQILSFRIAKILKLTSMVCILLFTAVLFVTSIQLMLITIHQITPAIMLPICIVYAAFPVSAFLMFLETLLQFLKMTGARDRANMEAFESGNW